MPFEIQSEHFGGVVKVIAPKVFPDHRGFFMEAYHKGHFESLGLPGDFVQDNHSRSVRGVLRGLHFQWAPSMGKLMRVTVGEAFLVAVDIRLGSPTFGQWVGIQASAENYLQLWAPPSFARGFCVTSEWGEIQYKCTATYNKSGEGGIRWNDPAIGITWPLQGEPILSDKDRDAITLAEWATTENAQHFVYQGE